MYREFKILTTDRKKRSRYLLIKNIRDWCEEEFGPRISGSTWDYQYNTTIAYDSLAGRVCFKFYSDENALKFKLTWSDYCVS